MYDAAAGFNSVTHKDNPLIAEVGLDRNVMHDALGPISKVWNLVYKEDEMAQIRIRDEDLKRPDPVDHFVYSEMALAKQTIEQVALTFNAIKLMIEKGIEAIEPKYENEVQVLVRNEVPARWKWYWPEGPQNPIDFITVLCTCAVKLIPWVLAVPTRQLYNQPLNLGDLLRPNEFIDALRVKASGGPKYYWLFF